MNSQRPDASRPPLEPVVVPANGHAAPPPPYDEGMTAAILVVGGVIYAIGCGPAINQRGFPPIDPIWTGMTYWWVWPLLLSAILDDRPVKRRMAGLMAYSFFTGFIDSASLVTSVPKPTNLLGAVLGTVIFGPLHLVVGTFMVGAVNAVRRMARRRSPTLSARKTGASRWIAFGVTLALTIAFPLLYRQSAFFETRYRAEYQAENDWANQVAVIFRDPALEWSPVQHEFDPQTGLKFRRKMHAGEFYAIYNSRIAALLREHGVPAWSMKSYLVPDDVLASLLSSDKLAEVTILPHNVNQNIVLFRGGTVTRWGVTMSSGGSSLSIATKGSGMIGLGHEANQTYVGELPEYPAVYFVRNGKDWIGAFHESGELLSTAERL